MNDRKKITISVLRKDKEAMVKKAKENRRSLTQFILYCCLGDKKKSGKII